MYIMPLIFLAGKDRNHDGIQDGGEERSEKDGDQDGGSEGRGCLSRGDGQREGTGCRGEK